MAEWVVDVFLGIVEGITEFLPISSTGHLLMVGHLLEKGDILQDPKSTLYNVVIQSGTVLAVIAVFAERLKELFQRRHEREAQAYVGKLLLAFGITGIGGLALKASGFNLPEEAAPVVITFLIGGLLILLVELWLRGKPLGSDVTWTMAVAFAVGQLLAAVFPGLSRSGATILMGMALGLNRERATEFSFLLGIPTLVAAGGLELFSTLQDSSGRAIEWDSLIIGFVVSGITAFIAVKWLLHYVRSHTFEVFGWYRFAVGIPMAWILL